MNAAKGRFVQPRQKLYLNSKKFIKSGVYFSVQPRQKLYLNIRSFSFSFSSLIVQPRQKLYLNFMSLGAVISSIPVQLINPFKALWCRILDFYGNPDYIIHMRVVLAIILTCLFLYLLTTDIFMSIIVHAFGFIFAVGFILWLFKPAIVFTGVIFNLIYTFICLLFPSSQNISRSW